MEKLNLSEKNGNTPNLASPFPMKNCEQINSNQNNEENKG
jgi:hypothetical protein